MKSHVPAFSHIWVCSKKDTVNQRPSFVNLDVAEYPVTYTKFQGHQFVGTGEEDFLKILPYMGMAAILIMWPGWFGKIFVLSTSGGFIWNLITTGQLLLRRGFNSSKYVRPWLKLKKLLWPLVLTTHVLIWATIYTTFLEQNFQNFPWNLMFLYFSL